MDGATTKQVTGDTVHTSVSANHLPTLYAITNMLRKAEAERQSVDVLLPPVLRAVTAELQGDFSGIVLVDKHQHPHSYWWCQGEHVEKVEISHCLDEVMQSGVVQQSLDEKQTLQVSDSLADARWRTAPTRPKDTALYSALCTPLLIGERPIGALTITKLGKAQFTSDGYNLIGDIGTQLAITLENTQLFSIAQRQLNDAKKFNIAIEDLNAVTEHDNVLGHILDHMQHLFNVVSVSIAIADIDELVFHYAEGDGANQIKGLRLHQDTGISGWVMKYDKAALVNDTENDERFSKAGDERTGLQTKAMICAPLRAEGRVWGTVQAINPLSGQFNQHDLDTLIQFANIASSALSRALSFQQLEEEEIRQRQWLKESITPIFITDTKGKIDLVNDSAEKLVRYTEHQLMGENIDSIHQDTLLAQILEQIVDNPEDAYITTTKVMSGDGGSIPVELHVKQMANNAVQWMYRDISQQVVLEKMRDDLTMMLLHDLKNPLSNIMSSLELLEEELPEEEGSIAAVMHDIATRSSQWLRHLIHSLLDINRLEADRASGAPIVTEREVVDIQAMLTSLEGIMQARLETKQVALHIDASSDLPFVSVNRDMIERVMLNLMDNALKFSEPGQTISLTAVSHSKKKIRVSVSDQGPGVRKAFREAIFDKYYQSPDARANGMGLGLAFCALTVEAHGGRIWVDDAKGGGARFNLTIPIENNNRKQKQEKK